MIFAQVSHIGSLAEGSSVNLTCSSSANPAAGRYTCTGGLPPAPYSRWPQDRSCLYTLWSSPTLDFIYVRQGTMWEKITLMKCCWRWRFQRVSPQTGRKKKGGMTWCRPGGDTEKFLDGVSAKCCISQFYVDDIIQQNNKCPSLLYWQLRDHQRWKRKVVNRKQRPHMLSCSSMFLRCGWALGGTSIRWKAAHIPCCGPWAGLVPPDWRDIHPLSRPTKGQWRWGGFLG